MIFHTGCFNGPRDIAAGSQRRFYRQHDTAAGSQRVKMIFYVMGLSSTVSVPSRARAPEN